MKKLVFAAVLFAAIASTSVPAQTVNLRANIPFPFHMGEAVLPAGEYVVRCQSGSLIVQEERGAHHSAIALLNNGNRRYTEVQTGRLEFNRYGGTYFLSKIWSPDAVDSRALAKTSGERELARDYGASQSIQTVALQRH